jgi:hypothetical protein
MNTNEIIFLFTLENDFFQALFHTPSGKKLRHLCKNKRGPKKKLTLSEVATLSLLRFTKRVQDLKSFIRITATYYKRYYLKLPNEANVLKATNRSGLFINLMVKYLLYVKSNSYEEHLVDSTDVPV